MKRGRPLFGESRMKRYNVILDEATVECAKLAGKGNLSEGLRALAKRHRLQTKARSLASVTRA